MLTDRLDYVVGVDSHRDRHALVVLAGDGVVVCESELAADAAGYRRALALVDQRRRAAGCGRSRGPAATGPASAASSLPAASGCSRSSGRRGRAAGAGSSRIRSMRFAPPARR
jgi:hypothetical protein